MTIEEIRVELLKAAVKLDSVRSSADAIVAARRLEEYVVGK